MSIKERIIKILIFPFPVLNDLDLKINRGLLLFITNPFMVYRPTGAKQYSLFFEGGHNVKTGTQEF
jgi:hypothetical protein